MIIHSESKFPDDTQLFNNIECKPLSLFDVLIKFLTDKDRATMTRGHTKFAKDKLKFKEIYNDDDNYYYTYSKNPGEVQTSNGYWYGYGRYLNCNYYTNDIIENFLDEANKLKKIINTLNSSSTINIKILGAFLLLVIFAIRIYFYSFSGGAVLVGLPPQSPYTKPGYNSVNHKKGATPVQFKDETSIIEYLKKIFNNFLEYNGLVKENKIGLFLSMSELNIYMKKIYTICNEESFEKCDDFLLSTNN